MKQGNAVRLVSTKELTREQWLEMRNAGIGSSDAAAAIGRSAYKSPLELWLEKTGRKTPEDLSAKEAVFWGTTLEPILASVYQQRTGNKVRRVNAILQHPDLNFMRANLDRAVGSDGILEIKTAGHHSAMHWDDGVPEAYRWQVIHQLAVTGKSWADVAVLIAGQDFRTFRIERDEFLIAELETREAAFWQYILDDVPPPTDGSASSAQALSWMFPQDAGSTIDYKGSESMNILFSELLELRRQREHLEFLESTHKQSIQAAMGSASTALFIGGKVHWKRAKDTQGVDVKRLLADHAELASKYATTIPGHRRFLMQVEKQ